MVTYHKQVFARRLVAACVALIVVAWVLGAVAEDKQPASGSANGGGKSGDASRDAAIGGFGGGLGGGGGVGGQSNNWGDAGPILMAASKSGKTLYGYSVHTGTWDKVRLDNPAKEFVPVLGGNEGFVVVGKRVYAFSGIVGRWDSIEVADSKEPPVPQLDGSDRIRVDVGSKIYMFSGVTGRWAVADLSVDAD